MLEFILSAGGKKREGGGGERGKRGTGDGLGERNAARIHFTRFRLACEPHQTLLIIACQLVMNRLAFSERGSLLSVNYQHNENATFHLLHAHEPSFTGLVVLF